MQGELLRIARKRVGFCNLGTIPLLSSSSHISWRSRRLYSWPTIRAAAAFFALLSTSVHQVCSFNIAFASLSSASSGHSFLKRVCLFLNHFESYESCSQVRTVSPVPRKVFKDVFRLATMSYANFPEAIRSLGFDPQKLSLEFATGGANNNVLGLNYKGTPWAI